LKDKSRWVRIEGFKNLGKFIYTLENMKISDSLLDAFCKMVSKKIANLTQEKDIPQACAFNFPAVL